MNIDQLETPVPVIDLDRVERNLAKMQAYCDQHGLKLRPHIKTHKLPQFALRQLALGAGGITCQKLGEAEVMADAGVTDILLSYPMIGPIKAARLAALAKRVSMRVVVDNPVALETVASAARQAGAEIGVLVEFDSGGKRTGVVTVDEALALAQAIIATDGLRFDGLMTYPSSAETARFVAAAKQRLGGEGIEIRIVSGGGTPNVWHQHEIEGLTELRVGTYIYHDRATVGAGVAALDDCALHLHATVVSRPTENRAIIDAGSKSLSSDRVAPSVGEGYGLILEYPDAIIERLNEEHGILDLTHSARKPAIGERVRIVPNHVCVVTNLHDEVVTSRNGLVEATLPVAARGRTR
ncbi:MAG TPA: alanine racemase [Aliidongia sp.]|uniref:alanine racemase n=1 Tax=Aliidongia sp. TaxID=1914230 RepID=UPI002DDC95AD|nr:alanine racemase [Aliidongia sp.]HEV2675221.1 alanine racemase [Aliidongia sp.]